MIGIDKFKIVKEKEDDFVGLFKIGPLPRGYGYTISNSLRRILLSSIPGSAIVGIRLKGVKHEYSTLDGLQEDVMDLILKLKGMAFKSFGEGKKIVKLNLISIVCFSRKLSWSFPEVLQQPNIWAHETETEANEEFKRHSVALLARVFSVFSFVVVKINARPSPPLLIQTVR